MTSRILPEFELLVPQGIGEALECLEKYGDRTAIMAGGTDLLVAMKSDYAPEYVLSLSEITGMDFVDFDDAEGLRIGAMATLARVVDSTVIKEKYPALWKSACENGTVQTRNVATVVGNILRASPAGDCCCAFLAYGGSVVLEGPKGRREVDIDEFWLDYRVTARRPNEIAVEMKVPAPSEGTLAAFSAMTRTKKDLAKINAAVCLSMDGRICQNARVAMGAVAPTHLRLKKTEELLEHSEITDDVLNEVVELVPTEIRPINDVRSTAEYRREVAGVLVKRTIQEALKDF